MDNTILIVTPTAGLFGGTERVLEVLISQCGKEDGIAIAFLTDGPLVQQAVDRGLPCRLVQRGHLSDPLDTLRVIRSLRQFVRQIAPSVTLAWTDFAHLYAAPAAWRVCPALWWQRTNVDHGWITRLCRWLPSRGAIGNSKFVRDQLRAVGIPVAEAPLYPPFESSRFCVPLEKHAARAKLGLPSDRFIVGSVGRMQQWKGFDTFVDALAKLRHEHPEVLGLIVGGKHDLEPAYEDQLRGRISRLGLDNDVRLVGSQRNVSEWMAAMDIFVHAAEREPFGIVVPEAMALGLPVIASVPGGPAESVELGKSGLLVRGGDENELYEAASRLIKDPEYAQRIGSAARERAASFGSDGFIGRLKDAVLPSSC